MKQYAIENLHVLFVQPLTLNAGVIGKILMDSTMPEKQRLPRIRAPHKNRAPQNLTMGTAIFCNIFGPKTEFTEMAPQETTLPLAHHPNKVDRVFPLCSEYLRSHSV